MHGLIREEGSFGANPGAKDLARHLFTRMHYGKTVIIADKPDFVLNQLRKQWLKLVRKVQEERTHAVVATRVTELSDLVSHMQNLSFTTDYPPDEYLGDVFITSAGQALRQPPACRTMYITCDIEPRQLYMITAWMPAGSLVVICKLSGKF